MPGPFVNATIRLRILGAAECLLLGAVAAPLGAQDSVQAFISRSDDGNYYVSSDVQWGRLLRFSADGVFQDAIGRTGEGPGEYTWPVLLRGSADTLTILDIRACRLTTIRGGAIATTRLPFMADDAAVLPDGRHVYNALSSEPDRIGHPLHLYDEASGRITRSLGG